jgi:hypothetical protein
LAARGYVGFASLFSRWGDLRIQFWSELRQLGEQESAAAPGLAASRGLIANPLSE